MRNQNNITNRNKLKAFFTKGSLPDESAFEKLIDSTFNIADDRLDINDDGLMIYPSDNGKEKLLSFFEDKKNTKATWALSVSTRDEGGIFLHQLDQDDHEEETENEAELQPALFIQKDDGKVGLGTSSPEQKLDVKGIVAAEGRMGNYLEGELDADGRWHNVFSTKALSGCNAFEIMAYAEGKPGEGKYALMHAIALSTFGKSKPKINKTRAYHGIWWNNLSIRWESKPSQIEEPADENKKRPPLLAIWWKNFKSIWEPRNTFNYNLQIKTKSNYGDGVKIQFKVSVLWDKNFISKRTAK